MWVCLWVCVYLRVCACLLWWIIKFGWGMMIYTMRWEHPDIWALTDYIYTMFHFFSFAILKEFYVQFWRQSLCTLDRRKHQKHCNAHARPAVDGVILCWIICAYIETLPFSHYIFKILHFSHLHENRVRGVLKSFHSGTPFLYCSDFRKYKCCLSCRRISKLQPKFCVFPESVVV